MKITVINGSPKSEKSDTLKITQAFLRGMNESAQIIDTMKEKIQPCLGCYGCWNKTPGTCVQKDGMEKILEKISTSDIVIWSTPLYCYSFPANCKALIDRLLPLSSPKQNADKNGSTHHPCRSEKRAQHVLISGCGFPDREGNYDSLIFQFQRLFGKNTPMILCPEAPMFSAPEAAVVTVPYLALVQKAGSEFKTSGKITDETMEDLTHLMIPADEYRKIVNG